jgi:ATP-dependent helicase/nuclease subunit A
VAVTPVADLAARERIRTSLGETLVVEAAAGTGKTTELVRRLINVLAAGRGTVESVAAVTFTDKAAGELKLRVRAGLEEARKHAGFAGSRAHLEDAIARLEEARIGTIHSFCADLLRERPVEARVDPAFQVLPDTEAEALYDRAFNGWIERCLDNPSEGLRRALRRLSSREGGPNPGDGPIERLRRAGWGLAAWRQLRAPWRRPPFNRDGRIRSLLDRLAAFADQLATCGRSSDGFFEDTAAVRRVAADVREAQAFQAADLDGLEAALIDLARDKKFRRPRRGSDRNYSAGVSRAEILATHKVLVQTLEEFERDADADLAALLQSDLFETVDRYEALKARQGALDFTDLLIMARDVLRNCRDVRAVMQRRLTHIFVDEFQDTDPLQAEIVLLLAADDPEIDDWRRVSPVPGKLFIVGDPKQSIYRFRRADVGTYQAVKALLRGRGAIPLELTTSFRAVPSIQRLVNRAFGAVIREDPRTLQAGYVPLTPHRDEGTRPAIVALPVPSPTGASGQIIKAAIRESLPDAVAAFVSWLLNESGWTVSERDRAEPVPVESRHICLLFKQFSAWGEDVTQPYVEALEARAVAHLLVGGKSFHVREEVQCLRSALAAIEWPDDELSLFATLKGSLFAIGDEELLEWRHRFGRLHPYARRFEDGGPVPDHLAPIPRALTLIRGLHRRRNARSITETIHELLAATRAHAGFVLRPRGEQALANVMRIADLARTYEASGGLSFRGFIDRLQREADTEAPEAPILEEGSAGVRIMTVHKAKGLEFPVVVLADPIANLGPRRASRYVDPESGLCALRLSGWSPHDLLDHEAREVERERAEGVRVAYVAATRARDLLIVPVLGDDPFDGGWPPADDGWLSPVQRAVYPDKALRQLRPGDVLFAPRFGPDSVVRRPADDLAGPRTVSPGLHSIGGASGPGYDVVWWDPHVLHLNVAPAFGLRHDDLIRETDGAVVADGRRTYEEWRGGRDRVRERAARPAIALQTAAERARRQDAEIEQAAASVTVVDAALGIAKPGGRRFGTLVHAVLAAVPLDATHEQIAAVVETQARILAAPAGEADAARNVVERLLHHPLLQPAHAAWHAGRCRRETPVSWIAADGTLVEGVLDVAFEDGHGWTILDFKTDGDLAGAEDRYRRQVAVYAMALATVTGRNVTGVLVRV